jgi:hypothetical protein
MAKALIKLKFRQIIEYPGQNEFEKNVLHVSYAEFLLKSQAYNREGKYRTFNEMKENDGKANSLHYKIGFVADGFIARLKNKIPGLKDSLDMTDISFEKYQFQLLGSDITNKHAHRIAIIYFTNTMTLFDIIGDYFIIGNYSNSTTHGEEYADTFMLKMQPELSVFNWSEVKKAEWAM